MTDPAGGPSAGAGPSAGRPPDLLFCRGCGGSIARREFLAGRALLVEGHAWCPACAPRMLARRRGARVLVWILAASAAALLALGGRSVLRAVLEADARSRLAEEGAAAAAAGASDLRGRLAALEAEARGLAAVVESLGRGLEAARREGASAREGLEDQLEGVSRSVGALLDAVEGLRKETGAPRDPAGMSEAEEAELEERLLDLNAGVRFEALWKLRRGSGPAARRAAVKGLSDPEDSVRYQAALLARDLAVREAIPSLVDCLSSPGTAVRAAALEALKALEGTDLGFDPLEPSPEKRAEAVLRWKERVGGR